MRNNTTTTFMQEVTDWIQTPSSKSLNARITTTLHNIEQANKIEIYKSLIKAKQVERLQKLFEYLDKIELAIYNTTPNPGNIEDASMGLLEIQRVISQQIREAYLYIDGDIVIEDGTSQATTAISEILDTSDKRKHVIDTIEKIFQAAEDEEEA